MGFSLVPKCVEKCSVRLLSIQYKRNKIEETRGHTNVGERRRPHDEKLHSSSSITVKVGLAVAGREIAYLGTFALTFHICFLRRLDILFCGMVKNIFNFLGTTASLVGE